jgi:hypothetical protein
MRSLLLEPLEDRRLLSVISNDQPGVMHCDCIVNDAATRAAAKAAAAAGASFGASDCAASVVGYSSPVGFTPSQIRTAYGINQLGVGLNGGVGYAKLSITDVMWTSGLCGVRCPDSMFMGVLLVS